MPIYRVYISCLYIVPIYRAITKILASRLVASLQQNLLRNILSSFPTGLRVKTSNSETPLFWNKKTFIEHERPIKAIKPFALSLFSRIDSFRDLFYAVLLS